MFELHWVLQDGPDGQPALHSDPGLLPLMENFTGSIKKVGYGTINNMSHPLATGAYGVARRFFLADKPFPIMQIGPGIFATNDGPQYSWRTFKAQVTTGVRALLRSYPALAFFKLNPSHLELRYVDVFDKSVVGKATLFQFLNNATTLRFQLPAILDDKKNFAGEADGRFALQRPLKAWKGSHVSLDIGSGKSSISGEDIVRMETRIITKNPGVPANTQPDRFIKALDGWLEFAHDFTSPFFKQLILPSVMSKFEAS